MRSFCEFLRMGYISNCSSARQNNWNLFLMRQKKWKCPLCSSQMKVAALTKYSCGSKRKTLFKCCWALLNMKYLFALKKYKHWNIFRSSVALWIQGQVGALEHGWTCSRTCLQLFQPNSFWDLMAAAQGSCTIPGKDTAAWRNWRQLPPDCPCVLWSILPYLNMV